MVTLFSVVLALVAVSAERPTPAPQEVYQRLEYSPSEPQPTPCAACGIGYTCDRASGRCLLIEKTPVPCVDGASYDEDAGFCIPDATPVPATPAATRSPSPTPSPGPSDEGSSTPEPTTSPGPWPSAAPSPEPTPEDDPDQGSASGD